ncbi:MAG: hypothetical protein ABSB10_03240 [Candidatus Bathyarchaeia archaeon]
MLVVSNIDLATDSHVLKSLMFLDSSIEASFHLALSKNCIVRNKYFFSKHKAILNKEIIMEEK